MTIKKDYSISTSTVSTRNQHPPSAGLQPGRHMGLVITCDTTEGFVSVSRSLTTCSVVSFAKIIQEILLFLIMSFTTVTLTISAQQTISDHVSNVSSSQPQGQALPSNASLNGIANQPISSINQMTVVHGIDVPDADQPKGHCVDSNGTYRGLLSSWYEQPTCECTCQSIGRLAVSVCDGCSSPWPPAVDTNLNGRRTVNGDGRYGSRVVTDLDPGMIELPAKDERKRHSRGEIKKDPERHRFLKKRSCHYSMTGQSYRHSEIWMSANQACVKCRCNDGHVMCAGQPHHCPSVCLPGQVNLHRGSCCETTCQGAALMNVSEKLAGCSNRETGALHNHGEMVLTSGTCVDQRCHCVNGRWNCLDYCTPVKNLSCTPGDAIFWDPFCCPRCPGTQQCTIFRNSSESKGHFTLISTTQRAQSPVEGDSRNSGINATTHATHSPENESSLYVSEPVYLVKPGSELALNSGRCICLNGTIHCSRPGRSIWHNDDCFYVEASGSPAGSYYSPGDRWTPSGDMCTECRCTGNLTYSCAPLQCPLQFVCSPGETPITDPGDCCPSHCEQKKGGQLADEAPRKELDKPSMYIPWTYPEASSESPIRLPEIVQPPPAVSTVAPDAHSRIEQTSKRVQHSLTGCFPLDIPGSHLNNPTEEQPGIKNVFPPGSRLLLSRPCRSLLCVCARDHRWLCTEHCPPACGHTFESIENLNYVSHPPRGKCCPPCTDDSLPPESWPMGYIDSGGHTSRDEDSTWNYYKYPHRAKRPSVTSSAAMHPVYMSKNDENSVQEKMLFYLLTMMVVVFLLFGVPFTIFLTWYFVRRRRRKHQRQCRVRLQPRRERLGLRPLSLEHDTQSSNSSFSPQPIIYSIQSAQLPSDQLVTGSRPNCTDGILTITNRSGDDSVQTATTPRHVFVQNVGSNDDELVTEQLLGRHTSRKSEQKPSLDCPDSATLANKASPASPNFGPHSSVPSSPINAVKDALICLPTRHKSTAGCFTRSKYQEHQRLEQPHKLGYSHKPWTMQHVGERSIRRVASSISACNRKSPAESNSATLLSRTKSYLGDQRHDKTMANEPGEGRTTPLVRPPRPPRISEKLLHTDEQLAINSMTTSAAPTSPGCTQSSGTLSRNASIIDPSENHPKCQLNGTSNQRDDVSESDPLLDKSQFSPIPTQITNNNQKNSGFTSGIS